MAAAGSICGDDAFMLHATYGFPFELTRELAAERGIQVDEEGFARLMWEQREGSRAAATREIGGVEFGAGRLHDRVRRLREDRRPDAICAFEQLDDGARSSRSSANRRSTPRAAAR